jgi:uncharacterized protein (DUF58 family)
MRGIWLYVAAALVLIGIGTREAAPIALGTMLLLTGGVSRLWSRASLVRLRYERRLPVRRAFVGEQFEVVFSLSNLKPLPVPWIEIVDSVPEDVPPQDIAPSAGGGPEALLLKRSTSLAWYERVTWRHQFRCKARGFFRFGPVAFRSGDIFGFFPVTSQSWETDQLAVLPRLLDLREIGLPSMRPFGEARMGSPIFEDQSRIVGVRDYRPGDPLKRIDWKATARRQSLQSRLYDPASTLTMLIAVSVTTLQHPWEGFEPLILERVATVAGSIARYAEEKRYAYGIAANCTFPNADRYIWIPPGRNTGQLVRVLESLAMISPFVLAPPEDVLQQTAARLPFGTTVVLVVGYLSDSLRSYLLRGRSSDSRWFVVWVGDEPAPMLGPKVQVYDAGPHLRSMEQTWTDDQPTAPAVDMLARH